MSLGSSKTARTGLETIAATDAELRQIRKIEAAAQESLRLGRSEAAWNVHVHGPLLELALNGPCRQSSSVGVLVLR